MIEGVETAELRVPSLRHSGMLLIDKPEGCTSHDVVSQLRRRLGEKRIGHCGTLDPFATGLLICLTGQATRLASFVSQATKAYTGTILLGVRTDSDDITGRVLESASVTASFEDVCRASRSFVGTFQQVPPRVSAVHIGGERAYVRARRGEEVVIPPREVTVFDLRVFEDSSPERIRFFARCSAGTYIRSIARDIGAMLGCGGTLQSLRRVESGPFRVEDALPLPLVTAADLQPWGDALPTVPRVVLDGGDVRCLCSGNQRVLGRLESLLNHSADGAEALIVFERGASQGALLLGRRDGHWAITVNMCGQG